MKISEYSPVSKSSAAGRKKSVYNTGGDFIGLIDDSEEVGGASSLSSASDTVPVSMNALLALQEMPDEEVTKRKLVQEGEEAVDKLENLRMALLSGNVPYNLMNSLRGFVSQGRQVSDPRLKSIINDIELRAAVEVAKIEQSQIKH